MHTRFVAPLGLSLALFAGSLLFAALAQTSDQLATIVPAAPSSSTTPPTAPAAPTAPEVTAPTKPAAEPVGSAPNTPTPKPVTAAPAKPTIKSTATEANEPTTKPAIAAPNEPAEKPLFAAPANPAPQPTVPAPANPAAKSVLAAPLVPPSKLAEAIINPPLPLKRPVISEMTIPAKALFARVKLPSIGPPRAIGYYPRGCLQGGVELPITGPDWQVMRPARNRNWGHPELIRFIERFARLASKATGWRGILVGDMAQPRGGPLPYGHVSHQVGLDVDIWYKPAPGYQLTTKQRNTISASTLVAPDGKHVNKNWTEADAAFIRITAEQPEVERVLVNAAIKKQLCKMEGKQRYAWMDKVRPWYGHADHMHIRLKCPADSPHCRHQRPVPNSNQCGRALNYWFSDRVLHPRPSEKPAKLRKQITLAGLPAACKRVLDAPAKHTDLTAIER